MIKILFSLALSLAFFNCGPTEDEPDDVEVDKVEPIASISVWDTVEVIFKNKIKKADIDLEIVSGDLSWEISGEKSIRVFGSMRTFGNNHFPVGEPVAFKVFDNKDSENPIELETISIDINSWMDEDYFDKSYSQADTLMGIGSNAKWLSGQSLSNVFKSDGAIMGPRDANTIDFQDFKLVVLAPDDTLNYALNCSKEMDLTLEIIGPYPITDFEDSFPGSLDSADNNSKYLAASKSTGETGELLGKFVVSYGNHASLIRNEDLGTAGDDPGFYVLRISVSNLSHEGFYTLSTSLNKF